MLFFHVNGFVEFLTWFQYEKKVFKFEFDLNSAIIFLIQAYQDELKEKYGKSPPPVDIPTPLPVARPENIPDRFFANFGTPYFSFNSS
jgi:hypothetical protein